MLSVARKAESVIPENGPQGRTWDNKIRNPIEPDCVRFSPRGVIVRAIHEQYGRYDSSQHWQIADMMEQCLHCMATVAWWQGYTKHSKVNKKRYIAIIQQLMATGLPPEPDDDDILG